MNAVPIPFELGETAPTFFRETILSSDAEWSQYKLIIDTPKAAKTTHGKAAFRKSLAKEMPYFHVWFELNGGMGYIVEDEGGDPEATYLRGRYWVGQRNHLCVWCMCRECYGS